MTKPPKLAAPTIVPATILAFPIARRGDHVRTLAAQMAARPAAQAEKHLAYQLRRKRDALTRKQVPDEVVRRELRAFEGAVRRALWFLVMEPPLPVDQQDCQG
jgi:hypothetical protein